MSGAKCRKNFVCPFSTFSVLQVQLVVLVSAFVMDSTVWSLSCFLFYSQCPRARSFVNVGRGHLHPCPIESVTLPWDIFTPKSIIEQQFNLNA